MIDVVFQLLIFFLCTASFKLTEQALPTTLPPLGAAAYKPPPEIEELELIRIGLTQSGDELHIDMNGNACAGIDDLADRLRQLMALANLPAVLDVSTEVEIGHMVAVYDMCLAVGLKDIHFAAPDR